MGCVVALAVIALATWFSVRLARQRRRDHLLAKYRDPAIVEQILSRTIWQGQTAEQLRDTLGKPEDVDQRVMKTKKREVWKYQGEGGNRYRLRITLDNDEVIGWDHR